MKHLGYIKHEVEEISLFPRNMRFYQQRCRWAYQDSYAPNTHRGECITPVHRSSHVNERFKKTRTYVWIDEALYGWSEIRRKVLRLSSAQFSTSGTLVMRRNGLNVGLHLPELGQVQTQVSAPFHQQRHICEPTKPSVQERHFLTEADGNPPYT